MKNLILYLSILLSSFSYAQNGSKDLKVIKSEVIKETQTNGKLDFFTPIQGKENNGYQVRPGLYASYREMALYNWAKSVKDLGIENLEELYTLYSEVRKKDINPMEKELLRMGFMRSWSKYSI